MKDTVITAKMKKNELFVFLASLLAAFILNLIGILKYKTQAIELITQLPRVVIIAALIYFIVLIFRLIYYLVSLLWKKKKIN